MWLCIFTGRPFEDTFESTQRRKVKQMQQEWVCIFRGRPFENTQWGKDNPMKLHNYCILNAQRKTKSEILNPKIKIQDAIWIPKCAIWFFWWDHVSSKIKYLNRVPSAFLDVYLSKLAHHHRVKSSWQSQEIKMIFFCCKISSVQRYVGSHWFLIADNSGQLAV